ncbi:MAG TPA: extracellular solute-binding protein [Thermomicrobiales bacterium]|nr:extracellular solute-binding protein [Thermomicrobiales bacterium]
MVFEAHSGPSAGQQPRHVTRRALLRGLGAGLTGLALAPLVAACGGSSPTATSAPAATTAAQPTTAPTTAATTAPTTAAAGGAASPAASAAASPAGGGAASPAASANYTPPALTGQHSLTMLMWSHFVPAYDTYFDKYAKDWGAKNNVNVTVDHIPTNTIITRSAAEIAAGTGHDMALLESGADVHVVADKANEMTALAEYLGQQHGGWFDLARSVADINGVWKGIPDFYIGFPVLYRKDLFDQAGLKPIDTWADMDAVGKALKPKNHPFGFAISATGDSNSTLMALLWCYGASWVAKDGKTITINSPETKQAIELVQTLYKDGMTPEVLSWDDAGNNRYLASGIASFILNPISAYRSIESQDKKLFDSIYISQPPAGPKARIMNVPVRTWVNWQWSKSKDVAEKFLYDYYAQWTDAFKASTGYNHPLLKGFEKQPMPILGEDPKLQILQGIGQYAQTVGYPGPPTAAAGQVNNTYVIPNMFAKAVTGSTADQAIAYAEQQLTSIYQKYPAS